MHAAIYARVSTHNGQDPTVQTRELREYCQRRGWEIADEYVDVGVSGAKESRPQLDALLSGFQESLPKSTLQVIDSSPPQG